MEIVYLLFSSYWIIPALFAYFNKIKLPLSYAVTRESVDLLSRNADLSRVFQFFTGWTSNEFFASPPYSIFTSDLLSVIRILVTLFALSVILFKIRNKYTEFFSTCR